MNLGRWSPKEADEILTLGVALDDLLVGDEALDTAQCSITVLSGSDASPGAVLLGAAVVEDNTVSQMVQAGAAGASYRLTFLVTTTAGNRYKEWGAFAVHDA
jgi:hypothetical protein